MLRLSVYPAMMTVTVKSILIRTEILIYIICMPNHDNLEANLNLTELLGKQSECTSLVR